VLLEAMAMGLPIVSTSVGGIPDIIEHDRTGFLVEPDNKNELTRRLIWLSTRPQLALDAASTGRRLVLERHSVERMADDYERLYRRVARRPAQPAVAASS
jgi:glycosyltransferase involved in cell wall biosynthesis